MIACGLPHHGRPGFALAHKETGAVQEKVAGLRRFGAASLDLAWVAAGRLDAYWERHIGAWDMAAGMILVREAGGVVTTLDGGELGVEHSGVVAGNPAIHGWLIKEISDL